MTRVALNLLVDTLAAAAALGVVATGYVLRYPLPPGTHRTHTLWGLSRHGWGEVHFWVAVGLVAVALTHLGLHWSWVVATIGRRMGLPAGSPRHPVRAGLTAAAGLAAGFAVFAWAAHSGVRPLDPPRHGAGDPAARPEPGEEPAAVDYWRDVYPVFRRRCEPCHGSDSARGGFRIDRREDVLRASPPR